jgi:UDP-GlcNAc:undecaprenyl-phosphate GlcNAc-1-phosphate transferase
MTSLSYTLPFLTAFLVTVAGIILLQTKWCRRFIDSLVEVRCGARHALSRGVSRFGGVASIVAFVAVIGFNRDLIFNQSWWAMILGVLALAFVGVWDDIRELSWKTQLFFQGSLGLFVFVFGIRIISVTPPLGESLFLDKNLLLLVLSCFLTITWIIAVMNAVNWADGIDGLCGGVSFIGSITLFAVALRPEVYQPSVAIAAIALAGASLGFVVFNFYPAKILAGTSGAWFFGFMLALLAIFSGAKVATAILVLCLPLLDAFFVVVERFFAGVSVFGADQRHLHHRLLAKGFSPAQVALFFLTLTAVLAFVAVHSTALGKVVVLFLVIFGVGFLIKYTQTPPQ